MNCENCGAAIPAGVVQCTRCGASLAPNPSPAQFAAPAGSGPIQVIVNTGPAVATAAPTVAQGQPKSKLAAGLLGIFLGWVGAHRFYLGYTGIGLVQLLLTLLTCFYGALITGPWGLVEGIMILTGGINKDANGRPLKD